MPPKKRKKSVNEEDYDSKELEELGIFEDEDDEEYDEREAWRDVG